LEISLDLSGKGIIRGVSVGTLEVAMDEYFLQLEDLQEPYSGLPYTEPCLAIDLVSAPKRVEWIDNKKELSDYLGESSHLKKPDQTLYVRMHFPARVVKELPLVYKGVPVCYKTAGKSSA
ncbi:hypothetical protein JXB41_02655, partial [Candidatus Woesearchaeota archaeon]|nr:hypothetical protein [Candidatus Woesearchaeota archaeon]